MVDRGMFRNLKGHTSKLETYALHRRYMYGETLGRWRTADLLIGLAYLARREPQESPVADIAKAARPLGHGASLEERQALAVRLFCLAAAMFGSSTHAHWVAVRHSAVLW